MVYFSDTKEKIELWKKKVVLKGFVKLSVVWQSNEGICVGHAS